MSQRTAIFAESSAYTFECVLCGFRRMTSANVRRDGICLSCRHAGLLSEDDVKSRTMPKCRVEPYRPVSDGDVS